MAQSGVANTIQVKKILSKDVMNFLTRVMREHYNFVHSCKTAEDQKEAPPAEFTTQFHQILNLAPEIPNDELAQAFTNPTEKSILMIQEFQMRTLIRQAIAPTAKDKDYSASVIVFMLYRAVANDDSKAIEMISELHPGHLNIPFKGNPPLLELAIRSYKPNAASTLMALGGHNTKSGDMGWTCDEHAKELGLTELYPNTYAQTTHDHTRRVYQDEPPAKRQCTETLNDSNCTNTIHDQTLGTTNEILVDSSS